MSAARKLRRQGKLPALTQQLGRAVQSLNGLDQLPQAIQGLNRSWTESRDLLDALIDDYQTLAFELEMQRAVSLRLMLIARDHSIGELLYYEKRLREEYVVAMFLEALLCPR